MPHAHFLVVFPLAAALAFLIDEADLGRSWRHAGRACAALASFISIAI